MKYTPFTEEEAAADGVLPADNYDFEVIDALDQKSQAGKEMIKLTLGVFAKDGGKRYVYDYLIADSKMRFKVRHFCDGAGILDIFERGELTANDCKARNGRVLIHVEGERPNPKGGMFPAKNVVRDYFKKDEILGKTKE